MPSVESELDIRQLFLILWRGKYGVISISVLFVLLSLIYSWLVKPEWIAIVVTDKPSINMLGNYYLKQQLLHDLSSPNSEKQKPISSDIIDNVYVEFIKQVNSYDNRRDFWQQSSYYQKSLKINTQTDKLLLDELINGIQFVAGNPDKYINDVIKLTATTAVDAKEQLHNYIEFVTDRTVILLNKDLETLKSTQLSTAQLCIMQQQKAEDAIYKQKLATLEKTLELKKNDDFISMQENRAAAFEEDLFQSPKTELGARIAVLKAAGPEYDKSVYLCQLAEKELNNLSSITDKYVPYRYLRSPEEPIKRNKPRRTFLAVLWGGIGLLFGTGIALIRQKRN